MGTANEGNVPGADAEAETEATLGALAGPEGVTAREREVASGGPHIAVEPEETGSAPSPPAPEEEEEEADRKELEFISTHTR